ncbi:MULTISPECIES: hypothetical protein [unclassified Fusibacter]|uniref:hypothetical protein n=1 Tax=unclassified Fusibacter TaxID=2624464 RepID=UPI001010812E|nr:MULTISPECIES: hypothetical protein [unclassified Fusibacter]MCK8060753.1 hypothetical protein [Fusibacter sp. A2]NPE23049.1 hypothetical protein [Fusibacter sp. A1]RXV59721.1 hypothetical protein DWB64_14500 [Fusibacter sp. A1]
MNRNCKSGHHVEELFKRYQMKQTTGGQLNYSIDPEKISFDDLKTLIFEENYHTLQVKFTAINPKYGETFDFMTFKLNLPYMMSTMPNTEVFDVAFDYENLHKVSLENALDKITTYYQVPEVEIVEILLN